MEQSSSLVELWQVLVAVVPVLGGLLLIFARLNAQKRQRDDDVKAEAKRRAEVQCTLEKHEWRIAKLEES